jgi:septal ring factor EnvC (AmiA/AmiB activator)
VTLQQRIDQHDREIAAIRKLMTTGMKMLVRSEKRIDHITIAIAKLEKSQEKTDALLQSFIRSLKSGGNGRH